MSTAAQRRQLLALGALLGYGAVFSAFVLFERPGLGIGHFYYLPITLLALAAGPIVGAAGGVRST